MKEEPCVRFVGVAQFCPSRFEVAQLPWDRVQKQWPMILYNKYQPPPPPPHDHNYDHPHQKNDMNNTIHTNNNNNYRDNSNKDNNHHHHHHHHHHDHDPNHHSTENGCPGCSVDRHAFRWTAPGHVLDHRCAPIGSHAHSPLDQIFQLIPRVPMGNRRKTLGKIIGKYMKIWENTSGWWFRTWIWFSISFMGCHPSHWLSYFSRWLKPPTSYGLLCVIMFYYNQLYFLICYYSLF